MSVVLYHKGKGTVVNGVECEMGVFNPRSFEHNLDAGWVYDPRELLEDEERDDAETDEEETNAEEERDEEAHDEEG